MKNKQGIRFCPKCKSTDITMRISEAFPASAGIHPGWKCRNCGLKLPEFPLLNKKKIAIKR